MRNWITLVENIGRRISIEHLPFDTKQDILAMLLNNCPDFEEYWMAEHGVMSFNETYVSQFIFGYEIDYHPEGDPEMAEDDWFCVNLVDLNPAEIDNTNRSVSDNVVAKYAAMASTPPPILVKQSPSGWKIVEGGHRIAAAKMRGSKTIPAADVTDFFTVDWYTLGK